MSHFWALSMRAAAVLAAAALSITACSSPSTTSGSTTTKAQWTPATATGRLAVDTGDWGARDSAPCAGTDPSGCMLPYPNDYYTSPDSSTPTGRRVRLPAGALPVAHGAGPIDPTPWESNDGFSPGSVLITHVPDLSIGRSAVATISDIGDSLAAQSAVVLLDTDTHQRWPTWSELDLTDSNSATQLLMIHPAQDFTEGHHYVVALRKLRDHAGQPIRPGGAFAALLAGRVSGVSGAYADHLHDDLRILRRDGVAASGLFLVWDFTVESATNLTAPEISMRDQAMAALGPGVPSYSVTGVVNNPSDNASIAREISGTFETPSFLNAPGGPDGSVLSDGPSGLPAQLAGNMQVAGFHCEIPKAATPSHPGHVGLYGHGLFGSSVEVYQSAVPQFSNAYDYVFCGTEWLGLSSNDLSLAISVVTNVGGFPSLADHLMQSLLDAQFLGRLMDSPSGFAANPAFQTGGRPLIDPGSGLVYYGNSEGGIMGGALTALSADVRRSVLGVPGMDYAVLLTRSSDFAPFQALLDHAYPSRATQKLGFDIIQMLWDRAEAEGYVEQMTGGLPATPRHQVLMAEAFGDHQVANIATETEARTIGAALHEPALAPGRSNQRQPFWDLVPVRAGSRGPALFVWDSGVPAAPVGDVAPSSGPDPHDTVPRSLARFWSQMNAFFTTGIVTDPCGAKGCTAPYPS